MAAMIWNIAVLFLVYLNLSRRIPFTLISCYFNMISEKTIGVIGLGYVGLPLAVTFGQKFRTIGLDIKREAIENYRKKVDLYGEVDVAGFEAARCLSFVTDLKKPTADMTPLLSCVFGSGV